MIYQLPLNLCLFLVFVDLGLVAWVIISWKWKKWRTIARIVAIVLFFGFSVLKLIATTPSFAASTPNELIFKSSDDIGKLYFARQGGEEIFILWEEKINGKEGRLTLEMEGIYPNGLLIFKEIEENLHEYRPDLEMNGNTWKPIMVNINNSEFQLISKKGEIAMKSYQKVSWANYASHFLSFAFLTVLLITSFNTPIENHTIS